MQHRLERIRNIMERDGLDAILISSRPNTFYYTGFTGTTSKCLVTRESAAQIVDFRYATQAKEQVYSGIEAIEYEKDVSDTLNGLCIRHGVKNLGIEGDDITFTGYGALKEKLKEVKAFTDCQDALNRVRMIKDAGELDTIRKAVDIADKAFNQMLHFIKPGMKEYEVALELEYRMKKLGASGASFDTIIASGPRSALPHGVAGMRELQFGDAIVMDFGAIYMGYCSDMTRTVFLGNPSPKLKEIYGIVLQAQLSAIEKAATGMKGKDLDKVSRDIIYGAGYEKCFGHGLGHGVGVEIHEMPRISPKGEEILKEGMVFTDEPGIYIENLGGVRIEDMLFLTANGPEILTKSTKDMIIL